MKRAAAAVLLIGLAAFLATSAYQVAARERDYRHLLKRGDAALGALETFEAIEAYSGAITLRPDSMLAHLRRGETYRLRGDLDDAARDFRRASSLDPGATRPIEELGDVLYQRHRFDRAAEAYEQRLHLDERSADVVYKLALARYREGKPDQTLAALNQAMRLSAPAPDTAYLRALALRAKGQRFEAAEAFERAIALSPGLIPAREELAEIYGQLDRRAEELEQLQVLAGLDRAHVERHVAVGLAHARAGHWDLAVLTLGSALERTPDHPLLYQALGRVWLTIAEEHRDRPDALGKALEALGRAAASPAATSAALTLYGRALARANQLDAAEQMLQKATIVYPVDPTAFEAYALVAERLNHLPAARTALAQYSALASDTGKAGARDLKLGLWSLRLNDQPAAVAWLHRAAAASAADARLLGDIADAQLRAGDPDAARSTIAQGLRKDPGDTRLQALSRRAR